MLSQVVAEELRVPLGGIIVSESEGTVRFRVGGSWDIDVYKSLILNVEQDNGGQLHNQ